MALHGEGINISHIAHDVKVSRHSVYKTINENPQRPERSADNNIYPSRPQSSPVIKPADRGGVMSFEMRKKKAGLIGDLKRLLIKIGRMPSDKKKDLDSERKQVVSFLNRLTKDVSEEEIDDVETIVEYELTPMIQDVENEMKEEKEMKPEIRATTRTPEDSPETETVYTPETETWYESMERTLDDAERSERLKVYRDAEIVKLRAERKKYEDEYNGV